MTDSRYLSVLAALKKLEADLKQNIYTADCFLESL